jgi:Ca2+-binding RTX toxin-like protein
VDVSFVKSIVHFKDKGLIILSGAGDDIVTGSAFDDEIRGGTGADEIYGKVGNDVLYGELGADELYGNDGNDRLITSSSSAKDMEGDYIDGGAGIDTVSYDHLSTIGIQAQQNFDGSVSVYALNGENLGSEPIEYVFT